MEIKFPEIKVHLSGEDGNAFAIIGRVSQEMRSGGVSQKDIIEFRNEAMAGDYDHLLQTVMKTVNAI